MKKSDKVRLLVNQSISLIYLKFIRIPSASDCSFILQWLSALITRNRYSVSAAKILIGASLAGNVSCHCSFTRVDNIVFICINVNVSNLQQSSLETNITRFSKDFSLVTYARFLQSFGLHNSFLYPINNQDRTRSLPCFFLWMNVTIWKKRSVTSVTKWL